MKRLYVYLSITFLNFNFNNLIASYFSQAFHGVLISGLQKL